MSRKSKLTLYREKISMISDCPLDIFNNIEPSDTIIDAVFAAEGGDLQAISKLSAHMFSTYSKTPEQNNSAIYFLNMGINAGDVQSAINLIIYVSLKNDGIEHADKALQLIYETSATIPDEYLNDVLFKRVIYDAENGNNISELIERMKDIHHESEPFAMIYLAYKSMTLGKTSEEELSLLCDNAEIPSLIRIPILGEIRKNTAPNKAERNALIKAFNSCNLDIWQDFWLKCIYEYCIVCLNNDLTDFAEDIARMLERRRFSKKAKLHALAFIKYTYKMTPPGSEKRAYLLSWYEKTMKESMLEGSFSVIDDSETIFHLMKEAAYTSEYQERLRRESKISLGHQIIHDRNRFILECTLTSHAKRGNRHMWETKLSIESESEELPIFKNIVISERRNVVGRGGATLEQEKKRSQIICSGEVQIDGKTSPFILDLILDIAYISTTKCERLEIKPKKVERVASNTVIDCQIYIF